MYQTIEESKKAYEEYIKTHISNIKKAFDKYGEELCNKLNIDNKRLKENIIIHDASKYSREEFDPYRREFFYSKEDEEYDNSDRVREESETFEFAWKHHYSNNPHHPEFWVTKDNNENIIVNDMSNLYIAEMLLDWTAMSMYNKKDNPYEYYYSEEGAKKVFSEKTKITIEKVIDIFKENK